MLRSHGCLVLCLFQVGGLALAQKAAPEPEYENVAEFLDQTAGALKPLERQTLAVVARTKLGGIGGMTTSATVPGTQSPVRFAADQKLEFVARAVSQSVDPNSIIALFRFDVAKDMRKVDTVRVGSAFGGKAKSSAAQSMVAIDAVKYGTSSFKITPAQPLAPGEYMIQVVNPNSLQQSTVFCFGVDSK
jgi:hypothetical protein